MYKQIIEVAEEINYLAETWKTEEDGADRRTAKIIRL
jgi:hypothetical protein